MGEFEKPKSSLEMMQENIPQEGLIFKKSLPENIKNDPFFKLNGKCAERMTLTKKNGAVFLSVFHDNSQQGIVYKYDGAKTSSYDSKQPTRVNSVSGNNIPNTINSLLISRSPKQQEIAKTMAETSFGAFKLQPSYYNLQQQYTGVEAITEKLCKAIEVSGNDATKIELFAKLMYTIGVAQDPNFIKNTKKQTKQNISNLVYADAVARTTYMNDTNGRITNSNWFNKLQQEFNKLIDTD